MNVIISYILTVYNKANYLKDTLASLGRQSGDFTKEFIFVDDRSTDGSLQLIEQVTRGWANTKIVRNEVNKGPSVRLNQGAQHASGKYLYLLDSDDVFPVNSAECMLDILEKENADLIYGKFAKIKNTKEYINKSIPPNRPYTVSDNPLAYIMKGGFVRMGQITTRSLYLKSGGCDERIFVQDESLPIRLCSQAQKFIDYDATVLFMPAAETEKLSSNELQQHHDGFLAYYYALQDIKPMPETVKKELQLKMISTAWKSIRQTEKHPYFSVFFADYIKSKLFRSTPEKGLDRSKKFYADLENIRRM